MVLFIVMTTQSLEATPWAPNFTDWHCHLLPGIDDGPATMHEAVAMAKALRDLGFATVHCTPHLITGRFEAGNELVRMTLAALQTEIDQQGINLRLLPGREYYLDHFLLEYLKDPLPLGATRYLLIEVPNHARAEFVRATMYRIVHLGYIPMIAHPERCTVFAPDEAKGQGPFNAVRSLFRSDKDSHRPLAAQEAVSLIAYLKKIGCAFQGNRGSFFGHYGSRAKEAAVMFQAERLYTHIGTDLHSVEGGDLLKQAGPYDFQEITSRL